jgi:hypothetical protein
MNIKTNGYKKLITDSIKAAVNDWIEDLKNKHKELLLTKQWKVLFPKGFVEGHNVLPVVTSSKSGKHLIAEVQFVLPDDLELDMEGIELVLKNEPYVLSKKEKEIKAGPVPLDESFDILNDMIIGLNSFLQNLNFSMPGIAMPTSTATPTFFSNPIKAKQDQSQLKINPINNVNGSNDFIHNNFSNNTSNGNTSIIENIKKQMINNQYLPDWIKTIESKEVWDQLLTKLAEAFYHYQQQMGKAVELKDFFEKYTEHLLSQGKLYHYCKYKSKPVKLDANSHCTENYCSKKPYNSTCPMAMLKFGAPP